MSDYGTTRTLLAALSRYARTEDWQPTGYAPGVWRRGDTYVIWDKAEQCIETLTYDRDYLSKRATVPVDCVPQAVDVLVALRLLPVEMATAFEAGKRYAAGDFGDCGYAMWPVRHEVDPVAEEVALPVPVPEEPEREPDPFTTGPSGETDPWCRDCCTDEDDPTTWCDCNRGEQCDNPCRQRAHYPAAHNAVPVVVPA